MSHRVTTQTEIKDKALAVQALQQAKFGFRDLGDSLHITSGPMNNATIDLRTGAVSGDSDYGHKNNNESLGLMKRYYAEAKIRKECLIQGISIDGRTVEKNGAIRLHCSSHFG